MLNNYYALLRCRQLMLLMPIVHDAMLLPLPPWLAAFHAVAGADASPALRHFRAYGFRFSAASPCCHAFILLLTMMPLILHAAAATP